MTTTVLVLALAIAAPVPKEKPADLDLTGEWEVAAYLLGGNEAPPGVHIRFDADRTTTFFGGPPGSTTVGEYKFDPKRSPAEIDITFAPAGQIRMTGIVKRQGDNLLLCFTQSGTRPTKFESPAESGVGLLTLNRVKNKE
jgi:uncharacterized protein (TIGR03067 family)